MTINVLQFICPSGYYGAERWVNALLSVEAHPNIVQHLAITDEPGSSDEVLRRSPLPPGQQHRIAMSSKFDLRAVSRLVSLIKQHHIHIIHTHGYKSDILGVIAAKIAGIQSVCTPHGFENAADWRLQTYMWLGGKAFKGFDWVCPLSPDIMQTVLNQYQVPAQRVKLIQNGVDLREVEQAMQQVSSPEPRPFTIGYIGQLISRKNIKDTIVAFAAFQRQCPQAELLLIGDGDERMQLQALTAELGLSKNIKFLGFRDDRLQLLAQFDCFVMTSSLEGIPRCLMEAMAANVCVTAFNIPGVDALIHHEQTGLLAEFGDVAGLEALWTRLYQQPELKKTLAQQGQAYVYQHFSAGAMAQAYNELYLSMQTDTMLSRN